MMVLTKEMTCILLRNQNYEVNMQQIKSTVSDGGEKEKERKKEGERGERRERKERERDATDFDVSKRSMCLCIQYVKLRMKCACVQLMV